MDISHDALSRYVIPALLESRVIRVTLTGGEPFAHPDLLRIVESLVACGLNVGICTNGTLLNDLVLDELCRLRAHVNVSLDGFTKRSHGRFRGNLESFDATVDSIRRLGQRGILQGLLVTPNELAEPSEYEDICKFANECGAKYVLMNPLSNMGRGVKSKGKLATPDQKMDLIRQLAVRGAGPIEVVPIRFPNKDQLLSSCEAGNVIYIFSNGDVTICPYLVFASKSPGSQHRPEEFIVGNVFGDEDIADLLDSYNVSEQLAMGKNAACYSCSSGLSCGKGCPAAVIASGQRVGALDSEQCPTVQVGHLV